MEITLSPRLAKGYEAVIACSESVGGELRFYGNLVEVITNATGGKERQTKGDIMALFSMHFVWPIGTSAVFRQTIELSNPEKALDANAYLYRVVLAPYSIQKKVRNMPKLKVDEETRALELLERLEQKEFEIKMRLLEIENEAALLKLELEDIQEVRAALEAVEAARQKARELLAEK